MTTPPDNGPPVTVLSMMRLRTLDPDWIEALEAYVQACKQVDKRRLEYESAERVASRREDEMRAVYERLTAEGAEVDPTAVVCRHCRKPIVRCDTVPSHIGCGSAHGWIHTNPEQWGHSCEPRWTAPYAQPLEEAAS
jgi:hypothetical protein